jgi:zinc protease
LSDIAVDPAQVEQTTSHISDLEAITPADIQAAARRYLVPDKAWRAKVTAAAAGEGIVP